MKQLIRYLILFLPLFAGFNLQAQNNTVYGAGISYTNGVPSWTPNPRTSRAAVDTVTGRWYHFNTPGGWQWIGNTIEEIAGCAAPAYTPSKGDSRLVINNCVKPQVYWYDGAAWIWINEGTTYFAGEGIRIENDTVILDSLYVLRFRTGDTTDLNAGAVSWNAAEQTLDVVINQGAVTGQMFQEVLYFTKNQTGAQIDDGTVVMAAGTTGNSGKILITPAIADGSVNSEYILGLATQDLPNGAEGMVTHFGKVRGIQTDGANYGETWVDGDVLYCSAVTPGYLTKVLPTAPNLKVPIAIVIHAHPSNGTLFVRPSHFPDLAQINDVQLTSPTNGQVLTYNSTLSRWENATPANQLQTLLTDGSAGNISISSGNTITLNVNDADASATNELQTLSTGTNTLTLSNGGGTVTVDTDPTNDVTGSGASGQVAVFNSANSIVASANSNDWNVSNVDRFQVVGAITNSPAVGSVSYGIHIPLLPPWSSNFGFQIAGRTGAMYFRNLQNGTYEPWFQVLSDQLYDGNVNTNWNVGNNSRKFTLIGGSTNGPGTIAFGASFPHTVNNYNFQIAGRIRRFWLRTNENSTYSPWTRIATGLPISGNIPYWGADAGSNGDTLTTSNNFNISNGNLRLGLSSTPAARIHVVGSGTSSSTWTAQFHNSAGNNNALMIRDDGNIGVGTSSPGARLQIDGSGNASTTTALTVRNSDGTSLLRVRDDLYTSINYLRVGNSFSTSTLVFPFVTNSGVPDPAGTNLSFYNYTGANSAIAGAFAFAGNNFTQTSGNHVFFRFVHNFFPTSGNATYSAFTIRPSITQSGGANGITRGFHVDPILGSAADWRSIEFSNSSGWGIYGAGTAKSYFAGNVAIGTTSQNASAAFEVASTTQGVLFPRMTTAQRDLIATPADGLVIYNTTDNKLQVRAGGAWVDLH